MSLPARLRFFAVTAAVVVAAAACGSSSGGPSDAGEDGAEEAGVDGAPFEDSPAPGTDAASDTGSSPDAPEASTGDATMPDGGNDGGPHPGDATMDRSADAPVEAQAEAATDAPADVAIDQTGPGTDAASEASPPADASPPTDGSPGADAPVSTDAPAGDAPSSPEAGPDASAEGGEAATTPDVTATLPATGATGVVSTTNVAVTFDTAMVPGTITTNTADTTCSGSLQVSTDGFATCVQMAAAPVASGGGTVFTVTPASALASLGAYGIRVTTTAQSAGGAPLPATFTTASPFVVRYFHTIVIDGVNDFAVNETFATTSSGYTGYLAWDATYLYVGMSGPDVASDDSNKWVLTYLGGSPGTTTGVTYNTQTPTLPFPAEYHVRWKADNSYTDALSWSGSAWAEANWDFSGDVYESGPYVEMRLPLASLGSPTTLPVVLNMLNETNLVEGTYAGVPSSAFTDGYDPSYATYLSLQLQASVAPVNSTVEP